MTSQADLTAEREALVAALPTRAPIYLPTQKISLEDQIRGLKNVADIYADMEALYGPKIRALRDKYIGHDRAFIIGNGPSLNKTDLSQLADEITFCVNGFFLKMPEIDWTPTFYVVEDHLVAEDRADKINAFKGPTKLFPAYLGYCLDRDDDTIFYNHRPRISYPDGFDFSTQADEVTYTGCTVTFSCMQLAHYMGFRELYLIGVDASYDIPDDAEETAEYGTGVIDNQSDDTNHFHPDYFGKGYRWHDPQVDMMMSAYREAEKVTRELGRPIYNATIGGKLEVFERRAYSELFPDAVQESAFESIPEEAEPELRTKAVRALVAKQRERVSDTAHSPFPKLCIIDLTRLGHGTATGELKATLLQDYPASRLMQVFSIAGTISVESALMPGADGNQRLRDLDDALDYIVDFDPDVVLFRPTPEQPQLTELAERVYTHTGARFVTWIMDGWQDRLLASDPVKGREAEATLQSWFDRSEACLAISQPMADAYSTRYSRPFTVVANAVDPQDWQYVRSRSLASDGTFVLRYSGGLAPDMSLHSLLDTAAAVEALAQDYPLRFEINTREHWWREQGDAFSAFTHTRITSRSLDMDAYRQWLSDSDANLIAYNFDDATQSYVKHSLANKLPECLASGRPLVALGPGDFATLQFLERHDVGVVVSEPGRKTIATALGRLIQSSDTLETMGKAGRDFVFQYRLLEDMQDRLLEELRRSARESVRDHISYTSSRRSRYADSLRAAQVTSRHNPNPLSEHSFESAFEASYANMLNHGFDREYGFVPRSRNTISIEHILSFYLGGRGLMAAGLIGLAALPVLPLGGLAGRLAALGPAVAIAGFLLLTARWVLQLTAALEDKDLY